VRIFQGKEKKEERIRNFRFEY